MPPDLQALMQLAQAAQGPQSAAPHAALSGDPLAALQALLGGANGSGMPPPQGGGNSPMLQALATAQAGDPRAMAIPGSGVPENRGAIGTGDIGPATDQDLSEVSQANQDVRGDLPKIYSPGDYTGYSDDMNPMPEDRQTPGPRGISGQENMGGYLNANKSGTSTEDELADVSRRMGGTPEDNGDFPTQTEIDALLSGKISSIEFDAKWGKGAAAEMQDKAPEPMDDDPGDHEYR